MSSEDVQFVLKAKDEASAIFKKSKEELQLLSHQVQGVSKEAKAGTDSLQKMANLMGAGWINDSVSQFKQLNDVVKSGSDMLGKAETGTLAMKAGLVALVAYGSFEVGRMFGEWIWGVNQFRDEFEKSMKQAEQLIQKVAQLNADAFKQEIADIKEFSEDPQKDAEELVARIEKNLEGLRDQKAIKESEIAAVMRPDLALYRYANEAGIELTRESIKQAEELIKVNEEALQSALKLKLGSSRDDLRDEEKTQQELRKEREKSRTEMERMNERGKDLIQTYENQVAQLTMEREQYEFMLIDQMQLADADKERLKTLVSQRIEVEKQKKADEDLAREKEKQAQQMERDYRKQISLSEKLTKELEQELDKAISKKIDLSIPTLTGSDSRLLTQAKGIPNYEERQLQISSKQAAIAEAQRKLDVQIEAHLKLIADAMRETGGGIDLG